MPELNQPVPATPLLSGAAWVRVIPFLVYIGFLLVADLLERAGMTAAQLRWLYPLKIAAVLATLAVFWRHYTELHQWRMSRLWTGISVVTGLVVFVLWINLSSGWLLIGAPGGFDPRSDGQLDWLLVAIRIAGAALVVPVMEELFWRSFLLRWLEKNDFQQVAPARVGLQSIAIAAVLFGFEHNLWLAGIVAGLAYSLLYMRQGSLWSAITAHAVTNGVLGVWVVTTSSWNFW
jgi:uncharacterized protein